MNHLLLFSLTNLIKGLTREKQIQLNRNLYMMLQYVVHILIYEYCCIISKYAYA